MVSLYLCSEDGAGKTMLCAGLGRYLLNEGKKVSFLKVNLGKAGHEDPSFLKQTLSLDEPLEHLSPRLTGGDLKGELKKALSRVSSGKDVVLIEGGEPDGGSLELAEALGAWVITIEPYSKNLSATLHNRAQVFGERLFGVVVNKVPFKQLSLVKDMVSEAGVNILGVLPEDRLLLSLTVEEVASCVGGKIIGEARGTEELVENFMLGAMYVGSGLEYFSLKANKAALLRCERPDMQLAALETETRCLLLTGAGEPLPAVLSRARDKGVPIIRVQGDITSVVSSLESALGRTKFIQEKKLPHLSRLLEEHFDFQALKKIID